MVFSPVGLNEDAVDLLKINGAGLVAHGFDEGADGEVSVDSLAPARLALRAACGSLPRGSPASGGACAAEDSVAGTNDEGESFRGERVVAEAAAVELIKEEGLNGLGGKPCHEGGEGDAGFDFLIDGKAQGLHERGLAQVNLKACLLPTNVRLSDMFATLEISVPDSLLLHSKDLASLQERSRFLLAMKFFELGELSSGQAAEMSGLSRVAFLFEAGKLGIPVAELSEEELAVEFG